MERTETAVTNITAKVAKKIPYKTIGFAFLCIIGLAITIVSSIMASTNFSWGEDPNYQGKFNIDLTEVIDGEKTPEEKELIDPTSDANGIISILILDHLPDNILRGKTSINEIKVDGDLVTGPILLDQNKLYMITFSAHIYYDISNIALRASLNAAALILIVYGVILYTIGNRREKDPEFARQKSTIDDAHKLYRPIVWKKYEDPVNLKRKINAWKDECLRKELALDNKATEEDLKVFIKGTPEDKANNQYCQSKSLIRTMASDEWINDNIHYKTVKYDKVTYRLVFIGDSPAAGSGQTDDYITKNKTMIMFLENLPRIIIGAGISIVLSLLVIDIISFNIMIIVNAFISLANIIWNIYLSIGYGNSFFEGKTLWDISFRAGIAAEYKTYISSVNVAKVEAIEIKKEITEVKTNEQENKSTSDNNVR